MGGRSATHTCAQLACPTATPVSVAVQAEAHAVAEAHGRRRAARRAQKASGDAYRYTLGRLFTETKVKDLIDMTELTLPCGYDAMWRHIFGLSLLKGPTALLLLLLSTHLPQIQLDVVVRKCSLQPAVHVQCMLAMPRRPLIGIPAALAVEVRVEAMG